MITLGIAGIGNWGWILAKKFLEMPEKVRVVKVCDKDREKLNSFRCLYPYLETSEDFSDLTRDERIEAIVIATPSHLHYHHAKEAMLKGKNVFVEKPMAMEERDAKELIDISKRMNVILMVGHLMIYHPAIRMLKEYLERKELGKVYYLYARRVNLGTVRREENVLWSFAPHDISMILFLVGEMPLEVRADGSSFIQKGIEDLAFITLRFDSEVLAHIHVSWLDPHKRRELTIVGSKKMIVFDDMMSQENIRIYDKGVDEGNLLSYGNYGESLTLRIGDIYSPKIEMAEPLKEECLHFLHCLDKKKRPLTEGEEGLKVVRIIEAAERSLKEGRWISL